ncbi:MAG: response regulator transcription factor [Rhodobacteraceae bacterium]|nr:response regulator transcription factor [Paracoccaceae bacterium]
MPQTVLIVDDDPHIREVIRFALENSGFETCTAENGLAALTRIHQQPPALIILDIGMPEMDGLAVCLEVRKFSEVPILFLTARDDEIDRIIGLELGGDDYVTKPFSPRELVARVKAILKRSTSVQPQAKVFQHGALQLDANRHFCRFQAHDIALTASEFSLLAALLQNPDQVLSRSQLTDLVYGNNIHVSSRTIDSHLRNIRAKLAAAGCKTAIVSVHGVGLRMGDCAIV